ncbi:MAG: hypothetical protein KAG89_10295 [Fulvimarina manganoxydans]|uniref:hypothetical protein n=1 Tax=Fulvimarina manganoxydans TaxID=937218 RepID=UPI002355E3EB|nr:hypothetical protein [Fulvimarina manganoxydans]MCK5932545.1 hypothetical protein [Fulvimarina manganoxydans]
MKSILFALSLAALPAAALAQDADDTVEKLASPEEVQRVAETLSKIGCEAPQVEKESDDLFEVDDATCDIGQYDIKLNGDYKIWVISLDE